MLQQLINTYPDISFREKRAGILKVIVSSFYEDGDMFDIFAEVSPVDESLIRISDYGLTFMQLPLELDLSDDKQRSEIFNIISRRWCFYDNGLIYIDTTVEDFKESLNSIIAVIARITNYESDTGTL